MLKMLMADDIEEASRLGIIYEQAVLVKNGNFENIKYSRDVYRDEKHLLRIKVAPRVEKTEAFRKG